MRINHLTSSVSALIAAGALAACGSSGSSDNGVASKSPNGIVTAASQAISTVKSVHIAGSIISGGTPISLDLHLVAGKGASGVMSTRGLSFKLISLGQSVYINGGPGFWRTFGNAAVAQKLQGKWLKSSASGSLASFAKLTDTHALFTQVFSNYGTLAKGQKTTVAGQQVVAIRDTTKGGTLYVATTGKPYPIELQKSGSQAGKVVFDQYDQPVPLAAPANAIDASTLIGQQ